MDVVYPVGSIYLSVGSTSPSSTIGGIWTQIKGAVLAAYGANSFASSGNYGGSLKISVNQMLSHKHYAEKIFWKPRSTDLDNTQTIFADDALNADVVSGIHTYGSTSVGGSKISYPIIIQSLFGGELPRYCKVGDLNAHSC